MQRIKGKALELYREKRYGEFADLVLATEEGIDVFMELCRKDNDLCRWYVKEQAKMWDAIFADSDIEAQMRTMFEAKDMGEMFEFQKNIHTFGFATREEIAKAWGTTVEDIEATVAENPELFRGQVSKVVQ